MSQQTGQGSSVNKAEDYEHSTPGKALDAAPLINSLWPDRNTSDEAANRHANFAVEQDNPVLNAKPVDVIENIYLANMSQDEKKDSVQNFLWAQAGASFMQGRSWIKRRFVDQGVLDDTDEEGEGEEGEEFIKL